MQSLAKFKPVPVLLALQAVFSLPAYSAGFTLTTGTTTNTTQTLTGDGVVQTGSTLSTSGSNVSVNVGTGTSTLTNAGTISQTGSGRTIDVNTGTPVFTLTNQLGGVITASGAVAIRLNRTAGSYLIDNQGTISYVGLTAGGERAIKADAAYSSTNNRIINGSATNTAATISSNGNDALRLGSNFTLTNYGQIFSTGIVNTKCPDYLGTTLCPSTAASASDGVAIENAMSNVAILNYGTITGPRHGIDGGDPVAATADSNLIGIDSLTVTSTGPNGVTFSKTANGVTTTNVKIVNPVVINYAGGVITGNNGSGVGLDGHGVVINYGTITGNYAGAGKAYEHTGGQGLTINNGDGDGVDIDGVAYVENWGTIRGTGAGGVDSGGNPNGADGIAAGGGTILNKSGATIFGQSKGILIDDGADGTSVASGRGTATANGAAAIIVNEGTITGERKVGVGLVGTYNDKLTNAATGVITGGLDTTRLGENNSTVAGAAVQMGAGDDTLINYGRIEGRNGLAIDMGSGNDTLKLYAGGGTGVVIGTIEGGTGVDTLETAGTHVFNAGTVSGFENFVVSGGSTTFNYGLGSVNAVTVDSGAVLRINGDFAPSSDLTVNGTFKTTTLSNIRTINVGGNLSVGNAGVLEVGLGTANTADRIVTTGTATLANGATITPVLKAYVNNGATYTVVTANGGLTATPASLNVTNSALVNYSLSKSGNDLIVTAQRSGSISSMAGTGNSALGQTLDALGQAGNTGTAALLGAIDSLSSSQAVNDALRQTSPETNGASRQASQAASNAVFNAFESRVDTARSGSLAMGETGLSAGDATRGRMWVQALGAWGKQDPRAGATGYKVNAYGVAGGVETELSARDVLGVSVAYTQAGTVGTGTAVGDDVLVDSYVVGSYFSRTESDWTLDGAVVGSYNDYSSKRTVDIPGFTRTAQGDYKGWQLSARAELGKPFIVNPSLSGRWLFGLRTGYSRTQAYTESGDAAVTQRVAASHANSLQPSLGLELTHALNDQSQLQIRARYLHELANQPDVEASFASGGSSFIVPGVKPNRDALQLGLGYRWFPALASSITVSYDAEVREKSLVNQVTARASWAF